MSDEVNGSDKMLNCVDCGVQFVFTARDQAFYQERGFQPPRRCKTCRDKRKTGGTPIAAPGGSASSTGGGNGSPQREQFKVTCSGCGIETTVPFKPDPNRPVYCRSCYQGKKKPANA